MRNALLFSFALHVVVGALSQAVVKFSRVRFVPREVYSVQLVDPSQLAKPAVKPPPAEKKTEPEPRIKEEKAEEIVPPQRKKPKPREKPPKEVKKTVQEKKITETSEVPDDAGDETVATGDMQLSVEDFPFAYYLTTMKRKIAALWNVPATTPGEERFCRVYFQVGRGGAVGAISIETSSGNFLFDQAALRAVTLANPLPPLPEGFPDTYLGVHFSFAYEEEF
ncbi:MAG: TonB family protein [Candidatus Krumholzibacteriia bacterium]